ncbi:HAD family hydrolase [Chloroflexota bacterium]
MPVRAIVFDVSGTLLNDIHAVWRATADAYAALGIDSMRTLEEFKEKFKMPVPEFHKANGIQADMLHVADRNFRDSYPQYAGSVGIFPEVEKVLQELKGRGVTLGVASNIPSFFLREHLREFNIDGYFDVVTGQEDCDEQKPSPKPIVITLEKLGFQPEESMYVGDMEEDIIAGKRAGVFTAAIVRDESYHPRWRLERQEPDFFISDLRELLPVYQSPVQSVSEG